jgi:c(7)-type cytochrome triheme protein
MKKTLLALLITAFVGVFFAVHGNIDAKTEGTSGGGDIVYTKPVKSVIFSHKVHVEERGLSCDMCHSGLFEPAALKAQEKSDFNMDSLYKGKYCGACHDGKMAFASNTQCARCHTGVKGYKAYQKMGPVKSAMLVPKDDIIYTSKGIGPVKFSHDFHVKAFGCNDCHTKHFVMKKGGSKMTMDAMYGGKFCGACHNGNIATPVTDCGKCHKG